MSSFPKARLIKTNGIELAVYEMGPSNGVPVVLCHGFPELAYSWRYQLPALAEAGYRVIAPDQRGYGGSSRPQAVESYDIVHLTGDLAGLLDALSIERAIFAGHDWGGLVVWQMPLWHPTRVAGIIGVNTPFLPRPPVDPIQAMRNAYGDNMYIVFFQKPEVADAILAKDVARSFRFFMRKSGIRAIDYAKLPKQARNLELVRALGEDESGWSGELLLNPQDLKVFVDTYERTGFTGGINWYRNFTRNWQLSEKLTQKIDVPALMIMAEDDVVLSPAMADGMERYVPALEKVLITGCGHWTQQEAPQRTNSAMLEWLQRRFPNH